MSKYSIMSNIDLYALSANPDASQEERDAADEELQKRAASSASNY